jgi:hypothetical protein
MNKLLIVLVFVVLAITSCKKKQGDILARIGKNTEQINSKLKEYTLKQVDDIVSEEHGVVVGYFRDDEAKKVSTQHFGANSRRFTDYYFDDGMLIFVHSEDYVYNKPTTYTEEVALAANDSDWYDDKKTKLEINRYYFNDNKLIKWTGPGSNDVPVNIAEFTQREPTILAQALIALKQLKAE